ncbi:hypothetical protein LPJ59_000168 [Coemansia sp. RSA 2399]|nr:hypothetical protein LPJ59_000168 [Coemansia sp. RSA 2399]KAJ1908179.1 hypothetical protein LPJ81_000255 [Coemansia sp. IMI 209127]
MAQSLKVSVLNPFNRRMDFEMPIRRRTKASQLMRKVMAILRLDSTYCLLQVHADNSTTRLKNSDVAMEEYSASNVVYLEVAKQGRVCASNKGKVQMKNTKIANHRMEKKILQRERTVHGIL